MTINEQNWQMFHDLRKELKLDKEPEPETEEVVLHERARPPGSKRRKIDLHCQRRKVIRKDGEPLPGEQRLKEWVAEESERSGLSINAVWYRLHDGKYGMEMRKVHARLIYVRRVGPDPLDESLPQAGEITFRQWVREQAKVLGISCTSLYRMLARKEIAVPQKRTVNENVSFVKVGVKLPIGEPFETGFI